MALICLCPKILIDGFYEVIQMTDSKYLGVSFSFVNYWSKSKHIQMDSLSKLNQASRYFDLMIIWSKRNGWKLDNNMSRIQFKRNIRPFTKSSRNWFTFPLPQPNACQSNGSLLPIKTSLQHHHQYHSEY